MISDDAGRRLTPATPARVRGAIAIMSRPERLARLVPGAQHHLGDPQRRAAEDAYRPQVAARAPTSRSAGKSSAIFSGSP